VPAKKSAKRGGYQPNDKNANAERCGPQGTPTAELTAAARTTAVVESPGASARAAGKGARRRRAATKPGRKTSISATATTGMAAGQDVVPGSSNGYLASLWLCAELWTVGDGQASEVIPEHISRALLR